MVQTRPPIEVSSRAQIAFQPTRGFEIPAVSPPYLRAANILYDPGFEGFVKATFGFEGLGIREPHTGSHMYTLPFYDASCPNGQRWPNTTCNEKFSAWYQRNGSYVVDDVQGDTAWKVSTVSPQSGTWGAVWWDWQADTALNHPGLLAIQGFNHPVGLSARAASSDTITFGANIKVSSTTGTPKVVLWVTFFTSTGATITSSTSSQALSTSYANYTFNTGCPSNTYYVRTMFDWEGSGDSGTVLYLDNATLGVQ